MSTTKTPTRKRDTSHRKAKKSYTLSAESVEFLEQMRRERRAPSISSVLDEILKAVRAAQRRTALEQSISDYYTSLSVSEKAEQREWGEFALEVFPGKEE